MHARLKDLTQQELEILNLACDGKSSEEIAAVLGMTQGAFQENALTINRKLGIENLPEADRKREMHRLCAAVADLLSGRDSSVVRTHDPVVETYNQALEKVEIIDAAPRPWWKSRMVGTIYHHGGGYSRSRSGLPRTTPRSAGANGMPNIKPHQYGRPSGKRYSRNPASALSGSNICNRQEYSTNRRLFRPTPGRAVGEVPNPMQPALLAELLEPQYARRAQHRSRRRRVHCEEQLQSRGLQDIHRCSRRHLPGFDQD